MLKTLKKKVALVWNLGRGPAVEPSFHKLDPHIYRRSLGEEMENIAIACRKTLGGELRCASFHSLLESRFSIVRRTPKKFLVFPYKGEEEVASVSLQFTNTENGGFFSTLSCRCPQPQVKPIIRERLNMFTAERSRLCPARTTFDL